MEDIGDTVDMGHTVGIGDMGDTVGFGDMEDTVGIGDTVSYTHLTLPTNREV